MTEPLPEAFLYDVAVFAEDLLDDFGPMFGSDVLKIIARLREAEDALALSQGSGIVRQDTTTRERMMIHKARYLHPGSLFSEETTEVLDSRDPEEARQKAPASAFAFVLYDIEDPPDLGPDFTVIPKPKNESAKYYLGGAIHTLAEVEAMGEVHKILASNMRGNRWDYVVHTSMGNWQPFEAGDVIVQPVTA